MTASNRFQLAQAAEGDQRIPTYRFGARANYVAFFDFWEWFFPLGLREPSTVAIDLSRVEVANPGGIVPLAAALTDLRAKGWKFRVTGPADTRYADYFSKVGWASALDMPETPATPYRRTYIPPAWGAGCYRVDPQ